MDNLEAVATVPVAKSKAVRQSGKNKGKLVKGCRYKGKRVLCKPEVAARLGASKPKKAKRRGSRSGAFAMPKTEEAAHAKQLFAIALEARRMFKRASPSCSDKKANAKMLIAALREMGQLPKSPSAKLSVQERNARYQKEIDRVYNETMSFCTTQGSPTSWDESKHGFAGMRRGSRRGRRH